MPDYVVTVTTDNGSTKVERLVRAKNEARAIAHVVMDSVTIERAKTDDIVRLAQAGVVVEQAE
jgi:hypothetical protein